MWSTLGMKHSPLRLCQSLPCTGLVQERGGELLPSLQQLLLLVGDHQLVQEATLDKGAVLVLELGL